MCATSCDAIQHIAHTRLPASSCANVSIADVNANAIEFWRAVQSSYNMEIVAGDPTQIGLDNGTGGIALVSSDCTARQNSIAFAFTSAIDTFAQEDAGNRVWAMCWIASQEVAHIYGLDHEISWLDDGSSACNDPMTYLSNCGGQKFFRHRNAKCGELGLRSVEQLCERAEQPREAAQRVRSRHADDDAAGGVEHLADRRHGRERCSDRGRCELAARRRARRALHQRSH